MDTDAKEVSDSSSEQQIEVANSDVESTTTEQQEPSVIDAVKASVGYKDDKEDEPTPESNDSVEDDPEPVEPSDTEEEVTEEVNEEAGVEKEDEVEGEEAEEADEPEAKEDTRFDKHPRFIKLHQEKKEADAKASVAEARVFELEPLAQQAGQLREFMQANQLQDSDFNKGMQIMAALKSDPATALQELEPYVNQLKQLTGTEVISDDLNQKIDEGLIDETSALELERSRAHGKVVKQQQDMHAQQMRALQQQQVDRQIESTFNDWHSQQAESDPDWGIKKDLVNNLVGMNAASATDGTATLKLLNDSLAMVNQITSTVRPAKAVTRKVPQATKPRPVKQKNMTPAQAAMASVGFKP